jgi:hypothetical protein
MASPTMAPPTAPPGAQPPPARPPSGTPPIQPPSSGDPFVVGAPDPRKRPWKVIVAVTSAIVVLAAAVIIVLVVRSNNDKQSSTGSTGVPETVVTEPSSTEPTTESTTEQTPDTSGIPSKSSPVGTSGGTAPPTGETSTSELSRLTCGESGRCVGITGIVLDGKTFVVDYAVQNFDPVIGPGPDDHHVHFFYDTVPVNQAGMPAVGPWEIWDLKAGGGNLIFNAFTTDPANLDTFNGHGATAICVAVANNVHVIEQDTASCFSLPGDVPTPLA